VLEGPRVFFALATDYERLIGFLKAMEFEAFTSRWIFFSTEWSCSELVGVDAAAI
jgi:hypothetical protein